MAPAASVGRYGGRARSNRAPSPGGGLPRPPPRRRASLRQLHAPGSKDPRSLERALLDPAAQLENRFGLISRRDHRREARLQELLHARGRLFLQPLCTIAADDMPVRLDETGHDGLALRVDHTRARRTGGACTHRNDLAAGDDEGAALDHPARAIEDSRVGNHQVLCADVLIQERDEQNNEEDDYRFHAARQGEGLHLEPSISFLKCELVTKS